MSKNSQNSFNILRRISKKVLVILIILVVPILLFLNVFHIKNVEVTGENRYTADQIKELVFQTEQDNNSLYLYLKYKYLSKPKLPFIEKIDVEMINANSVKIYVYEKVIAGCVEFMGEYLYFDKDGIVVESSPQKLEKVPVIKGLKFNEIILNQKLVLQNDERKDEQTEEQTDKLNDKQTGGQTAEPEQKEKLFDLIIHLTLLIDKYGLPVDSISFGSNNEVTLDCAGNTVLLGKKSTYDEALAELKNILKEAEGMELMIDMRHFVKGTDIIAKEKK